MTKLIILVHMSEENFHQDLFSTYFVRLDLVKLADAHILSKHENTGELKDLYSEIIKNNKFRPIDVVKNINCFARTHIYDVNNIKLPELIQLTCH